MYLYILVLYNVWLCNICLSIIKMLHGLYIEVKKTVTHNYLWKSLKLCGSHSKLE